MEVTIPEHVHAGDELLVTHNGADLVVTVPAACGPGDVITVDFAEQPSEGGASSSRETDMDVTVPPGVYAGDVFVVQAGEACFDVEVPAGCGPGDTIQLTLPNGSMRDSRGAGPSRRVSRENPVGSRRVSVDYDAPGASRGGAAAAHSRVDEWEGNYRRGEKVQVMRSSGQWCNAIISDYYAPAELYTVELLLGGSRSGLFKEAVTEEDLWVDPWDSFWASKRPRRDSSSSESSVSPGSTDSDDD